MTTDSIFTSKWLKFSPRMPKYRGSKSIKKPSATSDTGISDHSPAKNDILDSTVLLTRLRNGHQWLLDQHEHWQSDDTTSADDAEFSRVWNGWWELDRLLRADHGFKGCIYKPDGTCPDGFPCQGCTDLAVPGVAAQLELTATMPHA